MLAWLLLCVQFFMGGKMIVMTLLRGSGRARFHALAASWSLALDAAVMLGCGLPWNAAACVTDAVLCLWLYRCGKAAAAR